MHKKIFSSVLVFALLVACLLSSVLASTVPSSSDQDSAITSTSSNESWTLEFSPTGEPYLYNSNTGESILRVLRVTDLGLAEVDLEDYLLVKNSPSPTIQPAPTMSPTVLPASTSSVWLYDYRESYTYGTNGASMKLSPDFRGPANIGVIYSFSVSHEFGGELSLDAAMKEAITLGVSFDWHSTITAATQYDCNFPVPEGSIGCVRFIPYLNVSVGDLYWVSHDGYTLHEINLGEVVGYSPVLTDRGMPDGLFELAVRPG